MTEDTIFKKGSFYQCVAIFKHRFGIFIFFTTTYMYLMNLTKHSNSLIVNFLHIWQYGSSILIPKMNKIIFRIFSYSRYCTKLKTKLIFIRFSATFIWNWLLLHQERCNGRTDGPEKRQRPSGLASNIRIYSRDLILVVKECKIRWNKSCIARGQCAF